MKYWSKAGHFACILFLRKNFKDKKLQDPHYQKNKIQHKCYRNFIPHLRENFPPGSLIADDGCNVDSDGYQQTDQQNKQLFFNSFGCYNDVAHNQNFM